jgi:preprotein translocase subunit SecD
LLPSLDKAIKEGKTINVDGLKLPLMDLNDKEMDEFMQSEFAKQNIGLIENNAKAEMLMKQAREYFKGSDMTDEQFQNMEKNIRKIVELDLLKGKGELAKVSHKDIFQNLLKKLEPGLLNEVVDKEVLKEKVQGSLKTAAFHRELKVAPGQVNRG